MIRKWWQGKSICGEKEHWYLQTKLMNIQEETEVY